MAARAVENMVDRLRPGALVVTPGDRSDIILASALASLRGVPLAGLLLTCGESMAEPIAALIPANWLNGLPIVSSELDTYATAAKLAGCLLPCRHRRRGADGTGDRVHSRTCDTAPLKQKIGEPSEVRMPPPAFRHRLVQLASQANKRVVLPEGDEPRTLRRRSFAIRKARPLHPDRRPDAHPPGRRGPGAVLPAGYRDPRSRRIRERYVGPLSKSARTKA